MNLNRIIWFLLGASTGAAVGLLMSPASGQENLLRLGERGLDGAGRVIGKERVEKGRRVARRGAEVASVAKDSVDVVRRGRRLRRSLEED